MNAKRALNEAVRDVGETSSPPRIMWLRVPPLRDVFVLRTYGTVAEESDHESSHREQHRTRESDGELLSKET